MVSTELLRRPFVAPSREVEMSEAFKQYISGSPLIICACASLCNICNSPQPKCDMAYDIPIKQLLKKKDKKVVDRLKCQGVTITKLAAKGIKLSKKNKKVTFQNSFSLLSLLYHMDVNYDELSENDFTVFKELGVALVGVT